MVSLYKLTCMEWLVPATERRIDMRTLRNRALTDKYRTEQRINQYRY